MSNAASVDTTAPDRKAVFALECTRARVAERHVVVPAPQVDPANRLKIPTHVDNFFCSDFTKGFFTCLLTLFSSTAGLLKPGL